MVDVADCLAAAGWLARRGRVDPARLCIRGGSAGGFTTLAALARADTPFAAGADHFGVADLEALAADTHKFESRYLDRLVGPYPAGARHLPGAVADPPRASGFTRPLIVLQGAEDAIVPPNQSEKIVDALRDRGVPVAYLLFDGEQHGFRRAENIRRALDAELSFYAQVLGFELPGRGGHRAGRRARTSESGRRAAAPSTARRGQRPAAAGRRRSVRARASRCCTNSAEPAQRHS